MSIFENSGYHLPLLNIFERLEYPDLQSIRVLNREMYDYFGDPQISKLYLSKYKDYMQTYLYKKYGYNKGKVTTAAMKLKLTIKANDLPAIKYLINFTDLDLTNNNAISLAAEFDHLSLVKFFMSDPRFDPSSHVQEALRWSSRRGQLDIVKLLMTDGRVNPAIRKNEAVRWALEGGHNQVAQFLMTDPRVNPSARNSEALRTSVRNNHLDTVRFLLSDSRIDPSDHHHEAYLDSCYREDANVEIFSLLYADPRIDHGFNNNAGLFLACMNNNVAIAKMLLSDRVLNTGETLPGLSPLPVPTTLFTLGVI